MLLFLPFHLFLVFFFLFFLVGGCLAGSHTCLTSSLPLSYILSLLLVLAKSCQVCVPTFKDLEQLHKTHFFP
jgi:hypothetical protein